MALGDTHMVAEEQEGSFDGWTALAALLKALLFTCFFAGIALGCAMQFLTAARYSFAFLASAALVVWAWSRAKRRVQGPWRRLLVLTLLCAGFAAGWGAFFHLGPERDELE